MSERFADIWNNKPLRQLIILAGITILAVFAAIYAVTRDTRGVSARFEPVKLFAGLDTHLEHVAKIVLTIPRGMQGPEKLIMTKDADGIWHMPGFGGYSARQDKVKDLLVGLGNLEAYEPRTKRPEWQRNLGLLAPEDLGTAMRVELLDDKNTRIAALLTGKIPEESVDVQGQGMIYVRRDGEDQTWLARGRLPLSKVASDWLDTDFLDLKKNDIASVTLWAGTALPAVVSRSDPDEPNFELQNVETDRASRGAPVMNGIANAVAEASFDDVAARDTITFPDSSPHIVVDSFSGLRYEIVMTGLGTNIWATVKVSPMAELPAGVDAVAVQAKAAALNKRLSAWAYQIPNAVSGPLMQTKDVLTREGSPSL
ncbi:MAG: DUF4340 domain-containing protein [Rhizobiales bacterium]|nr:DUF4340 domain-containing protein [Hyphomicrobiales bacterium]